MDEVTTRGVNDHGRTVAALPCCLAALCKRIAQGVGNVCWQHHFFFVQLSHWVEATRDVEAA